MLPILGDLSVYLTRKVILIGTICLAVLALYLYISFLRNKVSVLEKDNAALQVAVQEQQKTITGLQEDYKKIITAKDDIVKKTNDLLKANDKLKDELFRETQGKKSIEELILLDKKNRVQGILNKATEKVLRCFEILTGAPLKPGEKVDCD
jgi:hypothetical protein